MQDATETLLDYAMPAFFVSFDAANRTLTNFTLNEREKLSCINAASPHFVYRAKYAASLRGRLG